MVVIKAFSESDARKLKKENPTATIVLNSKAYSTAVKKEQTIRKTGNNVITASELLYTPAPQELINSASNKEKTIQANIKNQNSLLNTPIIANLVQTEAELLQSIGLGFLVPDKIKTFASDKRIVEESEAQASKLRLEQQRLENKRLQQNLEIQKAQSDAQINALKDLYSTNFFEQLGFGISDQEKQLQDLIQQIQGNKAIIENQTQGIYDLSAVQRALEEAQANNPQSAQTIRLLTEQATTKNSFLEEAKPYLIVGGIGLLAVFLIPKLFSNK